jgi:Zinc-binding loop region of homing endonuclease
MECSYYQCRAYLHHIAAALNHMRSHTRQETEQLATAMEADQRIDKNGKKRSKQTWSASHICDVRHCCSLDHVLFELHVLNLKRRSCPPPKICSCGHLVSPCQHVPRCIKKA